MSATILGSSWSAPSKVYSTRSGAKLVQRMSNPELCERELNVLRLMAQGMSNLETGTALSIGESTVKSYVNRILSKLGVNDRTQAVIIGFKRGLSVCK